MARAAIQTPKSRHGKKRKPLPGQEAAPSAEGRNGKTGKLPKLSRATKVPRLMRAKVASGAKGIANARGFYPCTKASARAWEKKWVDFTYDIRRLADKYGDA